MAKRKVTKIKWRIMLTPKIVKAFNGMARELDMVEDGLATVRLWAVRIPTGEMAIGRMNTGD